MELAVNTFNKGIQLDSHPMVQGNDSLTDCLNGTFITMNGNEVILQNDMGNRRVDNAYLPSGYEPVGIKEYGGIIYIAAYNPITNRSLIGSFPSPERKINEYDDESLGNDVLYEYDLITNNSFSDESLCGLLCLKLDSVLYPLTGKTSLHAGDKFVIYTSGGNYSEFSNCNNTCSDIYGEYVKTPKNKRYTLSVGILNSLNQFVDITKTLCRWGGNTLLNTDNKSEEFKFNYGYFLASSKPSTIDTINDRKLIEERLKLPANTYSYKLVGPMYLKVHLNHIESFSYNIYGNTINDFKTLADLFIEGFITYNCPDGVTSKYKDGDYVYYTYDEGKLNHDNFRGFDLYRVLKNEVDIQTQGSGETGYYNEPSCTYNPKTNLYTVKIVKRYPTATATRGTIYDYVLGVNGISDLCLSGLSTKGSIDFSLLGSGKVILNTWRFINNVEEGVTTLTYSFEAYPKYGLRFLNLTIRFKDIRGNNKYILDGLLFNNGRSINTFNWGDVKDLQGNPSKLKPRRFYDVTISWDIFDTEKEEVIEEGVTLKEKDDGGKTKILFFLTTELFNDCYNPNSTNFINNYVDPETTLLEEIKKDKLNIKIGINYNITNNSRITLDKVSKKLININPTDLKNIFYINYERDFEVNLKSNPELYIINLHLYPEYIKINKNKSSNISISKFELSKDYIKPVIIGNNRAENNSELINVDELITIGEFTTDNNAVNGKVTFKDIYRARELKKNKEITNAFDSTEKFIDAFASKDVLEGRYGGIYLDFDNAAGERDDQFVNMIFNLSGPSVNSNYSEGQLPDKDAVRLDEKYDYGSPYPSKLSDNILRFYDELNFNLKENLLFIYAFFSLMELANSSNVKTDHNYDSNPLSTLKKARVWWKGYGDKWALFYFPYDKKVNYGDSNDWGSLLNFLKRYFKSVIWDEGRKEYYPIYCAYNSYEKEIGVPHDKNYAHNDLYSINLNGYVSYTYHGRNDFIYGTTPFDNTQFTSSLSNTGVESYTVNNNWEEITYDDLYNEYDPNTGYALDDICNINEKSYRCKVVWSQGVCPIDIIVDLTTVNTLESLVKLESSEKFLDDVNSVYSEMIFDCIDILSGNNTDNEGIELNKNSFYYRLSDGSLLRAKKAEIYFKTNPDITMDYSESNGQHHNVNSILCNYNKKSTPLYKFDITGDDSTNFISLDYSNIIVIDIPSDLS